MNTVEEEEGNHRHKKLRIRYTAEVARPSGAPWSLDERGERFLAQRLIIRSFAQL